MRSYIFAGLLDKSTLDQTDRARMDTAVISPPPLPDVEAPLPLKSGPQEDLHGAGPLGPEHRHELAAAMQRITTLRRAAKLATFNGYGG